MGASSRRHDTPRPRSRSEEHTSELQSLTNLVCRLLLEKKKKPRYTSTITAPHSASVAQLDTVILDARKEAEEWRQKQHSAWAKHNQRPPASRATRGQLR